MEAIRHLGAEEVATVVRTFASALREHREPINRLNVYPVPDGDTGTNMALTVESVVAELDELGEAPAVSAVCQALAHGSLMGARGNSGVILSQLLRGLAGVIDEADGADGRVIAEALTAASAAADGAVLRPVEGTILSVARGAAVGARAAAAHNGAALDDVLEAARASGAEALERTPEQLPVLKRAGVVDAGGVGFMLLLDACLSVVDGRPMPPAPALDDLARFEPSELPVGADGESEGVGAGLRYEVMYLLDAPDHTMSAFKEVWAGLGDSIVVVGGDGLWNCHIHTDDVGAAIEAALDAGRPHQIRVTDLAEQVEEERWVREGSAGDVHPDEPTGPPPRTAVVAVANGDGIGRIFRSLGVRHLVAGGQSMNPSTADILAVVDAIDSPEVVLLPNNDNIRPVCMQVTELAHKTVRVVPTSGIVEGFAALLEYDPQTNVDRNATAMAASARRVVAGEVTRAVRDAEGPNGPIAAGDWMGLSRDGVEVTAPTVAEAACALIDTLCGPEHELVTLIEGEGVKAGDTRQVTGWLEEHRADVAVEVHHGGQPLYPYLISIE